MTALALVSLPLLSLPLVSLPLMTLVLLSTCLPVRALAQQLPFSPAEAAAITGRVVDRDGRPLAAMTVRLIRVSPDSSRLEVQQTSVTDQQGLYRLSPQPGTYLVECLSGKNGSEWAFYPSTPDASRATRVEAAAGQTVTGVEIRFVRRLARLSGRIVTAAGEPLLPQATDEDGSLVRGHLFLNYSHSAGTLSLSERTAQPDRNGVFQFEDVEPGEYVLYAVRESVRSVSVGDTVGGAVREFVVRTVVVPGPDIEPLELRLAPTGTIKGRIVFEGTTRPLFTSLPQISALQRGISEWPQLQPRLSTMFDPVLFEDGTFDLGGVIGSALIQLSNLPPGIYHSTVTRRSCRTRPGDRSCRR